MFYDFVKSKLETGTVKVVPAPRGSNGRTHIKARGMTAIAVMFLSREEQEKIESLSKFIAMRRVRVHYCDANE